MPCPYFEPEEAVSGPQSTRFRLPLLEEYKGRCHAKSDGSLLPPPEHLRFCNHGYSQGCCEHFPIQDERSCFRYSVTQRSEVSLSFICVEEKDYIPVRWHALQYNLASGTVEPQLTDLCLRTQAIAFCRSYLKRFPG